MRLYSTFLLVALLFFGCRGKEKVTRFSNGKPIPKPISWVSDYDGIFTDEEEKVLNTLIAGFEKETGYEIAIVTLDTNTVANFSDDMFTLTFEIAKAWGVGKSNKDNGVFIGICKGKRKMYIQNGIGTAKVLSDEQTKKFIDSVFVPYFKQGEYYKGTLEGTKAIINFLRDKEIPKQ